MIEKLKKYQHAISNKQQTSFQIHKIFKSIKWTEIPSTTNRNMLLNFSEKPVSFFKMSKKEMCDNIQTFDLYKEEQCQFLTHDYNIIYITIMHVTIDS